VPDTAPPRIGVLLVNLGTPDAPTPAAVRRYLREFLSDRRVVDLPRALWWPILHGIVLPLRPRKVAPQYQRIWRHEGSPLLVLMRELRQALEQRLVRELRQPVAVVKAMRYGQPSIATALQQLRQTHVRDVLVLPLYPQHSGTTTGSALDAVFDWFRHHDWHPDMATVRGYHDDPGYIHALAETVRGHWATAGRGQRLLMSFHGIPQRYVARGDPYEQHCRATAGQLARALQLAPDEWIVAYQSRVGGGRWLGPYTDEVLRELAQGGVTRVDVICPGFAVDCLETLDEIVIRYQRLFVAAGGQALRYVPALNATPAHVEALAWLVISTLARAPALQA
jgi:ferrochelatase